jgi:long-chain acyl-CoA synthetase
MTNLAGILAGAQAARGDAPAVRQGDRWLSYTDLARAGGQVAVLLREAGAGPGDRLALMMPNVLAHPVLFYGALAAAASWVPMNPLLKSREVARPPAEAQPPAGARPPAGIQPRERA